MTTNDITGDSIQSGNRKENTEAIRNNWDAIFGKKDKPKNKEVKDDSK